MPNPLLTLPMPGFPLDTFRDWGAACVCKRGHEACVTGSRAMHRSAHRDIQVSSFGG